MIFTYHKYKTIILYQQFIFTPNFYSFPDKEGQWSSTPHISTTAGVYNHRQGFPAATCPAPCAKRLVPSPFGGIRRGLLFPVCNKKLGGRVSGFWQTGYAQTVSIARCAPLCPCCPNKSGCHRYSPPGGYYILPQNYT